MKSESEKKLLLNQWFTQVIQPSKNLQVLY
jgi:hypothetical protein